MKMWEIHTLRGIHGKKKLTKTLSPVLQFHTDNWSSLRGSPYHCKVNPRNKVATVVLLTTTELLFNPLNLGLS